MKKRRREGSQPKRNEENERDPWFGWVNKQETFVSVNASPIFKMKSGKRALAGNGPRYGLRRVQMNRV